LSLQLILLFYTAECFALTTETLPTNIYSPAFRYGQISGLEDRYTENGTLVRLTDYKSIEFDADTLAKFNAKANELIATLNKFGLYKAGDLFNLGTLQIETKPEIKYFAPILAKGISETWTIALGLPVIKYSNQISLTQKFSNIDYYNQFRGLSPELDQALDTDLSAETQKVILAKGYQPLQSQQKQFLGDIQLVSVKKILQNINSSLVHLLTVTLPTGPNYDADNLLALNFPQKITARVPKNTDDVLPDNNSKDEVTKSAGLTFETGLQLVASFSDQFKLSGGYVYGEKQADTYSSSSKGDSSILALNTKSKLQKVNLDLSYSTVQNYINSKKFIPMIVSLNIYDTIAGVNVERRLGQELNLTLFF
jgi:hypothetical protein